MNRFYTGEAHDAAAGEQYTTDQMTTAAWQAASRVSSAGFLGALGDLPAPLRLNATWLLRHAAHDVGCCLALILETIPPGAGCCRRRAAQLNTISDLRDALDAFLAETVTAEQGGESIDATFAAAAEIIGDEWPAILAEATTIATETAARRPN